MARSTVKLKLSPQTAQVLRTLVNSAAELPEEAALPEAVKTSLAEVSAAITKGLRDASRKAS